VVQGVGEEVQGGAWGKCGRFWSMGCGGSGRTWWFWQAWWQGGFGVMVQGGGGEVLGCHGEMIVRY